MKITIRPMSLMDVTAIYALEIQCFSQAWSISAITEAIIRNDYFYVGAYFGNDLVGYAGMLCAPGEGQIFNVAVSPRHRRQGVAMALLQELSVEAGRRALGSLVLEVRASNVGAQTLYERAGYKRVGVRRAFYSKPREDAFIYMKSER